MTDYYIDRNTNRILAANLCAIYAKRITLIQKDIQLVRDIRGHIIRYKWVREIK
jgi:histone H3/H4